MSIIVFPRDVTRGKREKNVAVGEKPFRHGVNAGNETSSTWKSLRAAGPKSFSIARWDH